MVASKTDNGDFEAKLLVRQEALSHCKGKPRILDCFAGEGHMYNLVWKDACSSYLGFDKRFSRPEGDKDGECWRGDNERLIHQATKRDWDLVDLDAYANPWVLLRKVVKAARVDDLVVTTTCGIDRAIRVGSSDFACAVIGASRLSYTGLLTRWYDDVIRCALKWALTGTPYRLTKVRRIQGIHNQQMRYWLLVMTRN